MKISFIRPSAYTFFSYNTKENPPKFIGAYPTDDINNSKATTENFSDLLGLMYQNTDFGDLLVSSEGFGGKEIIENNSNPVSNIYQNIREFQSFLLNSIFKVEKDELNVDNGPAFLQLNNLKVYWQSFLSNPSNSFITPYMNDDECRFNTQNDPFVLRGTNELGSIFPEGSQKKGNGDNINIIFSTPLFWCKSLFIQQKKQYIRNYKIQQRLPYHGTNDVSFNNLFANQNQAGKDFYVGGYPSSFLGPIQVDGQPYTLFLRICIDVALGPTGKELTQINGYAQNQKIFVIQSASVTPKAFFTDANLGAFADNTAIDLIGYLITQSGKTDRTFETTRWPNTFMLPYGFWVPSLSDKGSLLAKKYFEFLSKFDYMVFADSSGYDFTDDYNLEELTLDMFGDLANPDNPNKHMEVTNVATLLSTSPQNVKDVLEITQMNQDNIKIIASPKKVGNIYKITKQTDSAGRVSLLFQQVKREATCHYNSIDYSLFNLTQLDPPPGQQEEYATHLEESVTG